ncbi:MAG: DnaD domain protein [Oscillospiraceae bacterium]|nr:DnaD domain protein [Oscillospiraceae bacterium]
MAEYILLGGQTESVVLSGEITRRLIHTGNGDAALAYLAFALGRGSEDGSAVCKQLGWTPSRFEGAVRALEVMGLVARPNGTAVPVEEEIKEPEIVRTEYTRADVVRALEGQDFSALATEIENTLGKKLTIPELTMLLGLYNDVGMGVDMIFLLVNFCIERSIEQYGEGRKPTMRQIEREGYLWARMGLMDQDSASVYIKKYKKRREVLPRIMKLLGLGERRASPTEEKYMVTWSEMGFEDAVIELAYDKTVLKCKELRWPYMNKILTTWHGKGLHTLQAVEEGDRPSQKRAEPVRDDGVPKYEDFARMERYLQQLRGENSGKGES